MQQICLDKLLIFTMPALSAVHEGFLAADKVHHWDVCCKGSRQHATCGLCTAEAVGNPLKKHSTPWLCAAEDATLWQTHNPPMSSAALRHCGYSILMTTAPACRSPVWLDSWTGWPGPFSLWYQVREVCHDAGMT